MSVPRALVSRAVGALPGIRRHDGAHQLLCDACRLPDLVLVTAPHGLEWSIDPLGGVRVSVDVVEGAHVRQGVLGALTAPMVLRLVGRSVKYLVVLLETEADSPAVKR